MPVSGLHRQVAAVALAARGHGFALGGGNALLAHGVISRPTQDVDLFTDQEDGVPAAAGAVETALRGAGFEAERLDLAVAYQEAGDLGRAIPLHEQALADYERVLGADHPDTLTSRSNLAAAYQVMGDLGRAIPLYEQALADVERVLGTDHPHAKIVRGNLAKARQDSQ